MVAMECASLTGILCRWRIHLADVVEGVGLGMVSTASRYSANVPGSSIQCVCMKQSVPQWLGRSMDCVRVYVCVCDCVCVEVGLPPSEKKQSVRCMCDCALGEVW